MCFLIIKLNHLSVLENLTTAIVLQAALSPVGLADDGTERRLGDVPY